MDIFSNGYQCQKINQCSTKNLEITIKLQETSMLTNCRWAVFLLFLRNYTIFSVLSSSDCVSCFPCDARQPKYNCMQYIPRWEKCSVIGAEFHYHDQKIPKLMSLVYRRQLLDVLCDVSSKHFLLLWIYLNPLKETWKQHFSRQSYFYVLSFFSIFF